MDKSESIKNLIVALNKAQAELKPALKDSTNPFFKSKYADFTSVWDTCREVITKHGLSIMQVTDIVDGHNIIETMLCHISGEWVTGKFILTPVKNDPQSMGSALTYARRYTLSSIICLATEEDDDAEGATREEKPTTKKPQSKPASTTTKPPADAKSEKISEAQVRYMYGLFDNLGTTDKDEVKKITALELEIAELKSLKDLSKKQGIQMINLLNKKVGELKGSEDI